MSEIKAKFLHLLFITKYHSPFVDVVIEDTQLKEENVQKLKLWTTDAKSESSLKDF